MVRTVHDSIKGRARFRVEGLYRAEKLRQQIETALGSRKDISGFSVNVLTGSVLVFFNSGNTASSIRTIIEDSVSGFQGTRATNKKSDTFRSSLIPRKNPNTALKTRAKNKPLSRRKMRKSVLRAEEQQIEPWHIKDSAEILSSSGSDPDTGLSISCVGERIKKFGPNLLPEAVPRSGFSIFADQFKSLPVALLGVAAGVSIATGGIVDAIVIAGVVLINGVIGYTTEVQAEKTINSLKSLVRPTGLCIRDGVLANVPSEEIVPGDILVLRPGSYVTADARLIAVTHLSIDESALTGESMPVLKSAVALADEELPLADRINMVYMGTLVTGGQGLALVVATGRYTEIGKIQTLVGDARPPETPMEKQLDRIGTQLVYISGAVCGLVFVIGLLRGYGFLQMLKTSIALAVAAVPEGLPMVATTTLALGIRNMKRHNVLIRHLEAVETLGSVQTICLDKTGTITVNKMTVVSIFAGMKRINVASGKFRYGEADLNPYEHDEIIRLVHVSCLCNESEVQGHEGEFIVRGSATENALVNVALSSGVNVRGLRDKFPLMKVKHRSENCNLMATLHEVKPNFADGNGSKLIAVKGSPQEVLSICSSYMKDGKTLPLTEDERASIQIENERMAGEALRVLGIAYALCENEIEFLDLSDLCGVPVDDVNLVWLGLAGMIDPVRSGVRELIGQFHISGINTIMITGDQGPTAYAIGRDLNLSRDGQIEILDSTHLGKLGPEMLNALTQKVHVFSRVSPANKLQIVQALQATGRIVAMTGDGINDGPALKASDIGIAMGHTGTDVAREVADVVLEDDNLETMIIAISQGRTIYNNIRKSVHYLLATNMSEIMVMFGSLAVGMGQPLNAMQLLWINLVTDIAPGLALALEAPEPDVLSKPPRNPDEPIVRRDDFKKIVFESSMLSAGSLAAYGYGIMRYGMGPQAGTMAFMGLTFGQILHAISCRSENISMYDKEKLLPNRYLDGALIGSSALQGLAMAIPGMRSLLGLSPLGIADWIVVAGAATAPLLINEAVKKRANITTKNNPEEDKLLPVSGSVERVEITT